MRPRKFYIGFPPADREARRTTGSSTASGSIPLGGFVKIPGMHRPARGRRRSAFARAVEEAPALRAGRPAAALARAGDHDAARASARRASRSSPPSATLSEHARADVEKGVADLGDALGPDAYWRAKTWKRVLVIFAGPAANIVFAFVLFTVLYMTSGGARRRRRSELRARRLARRRDRASRQATRSSRSTAFA